MATGMLAAAVSINRVLDPRCLNLLRRGLLTASTSTAPSSSSPAALTSGRCMDSDAAIMNSRTLPEVVEAAQFPDSVWQHIANIFKGLRVPEAVDVNCASGFSAIELAKRGFRVTGVEPDVHLLAQAKCRADSHNVELNLLGSMFEDKLLRNASADLLTVLHVCGEKDLLQNFNRYQRVLKDGGYFVTAWNDRDRSSVFVQDLEDLMDFYNPDYNCKDQECMAEQMIHALGKGESFKLESYSIHENELLLKYPTMLVDMISTGRLRGVLAGSSAVRKSLHRDVRTLVENHFGHGPIRVPLETKLFVLRKLGQLHRGEMPHKEQEVKRVGQARSLGL